MENKLGTPQICPKCKQYNNSGLILPEQCRYCQKDDNEENINDNKITTG